MIKTYKIGKIQTRDKKTGKISGLMIPIWKDYDKMEKIQPRFIYYTTCNPKNNKGPYFHKKRRGLLTLVAGKIIFVYKSGKNFKELKLDATKNEAIMIDIPKRISYLLKNPHSKAAQLINICDHPWVRGEQETLTPDFSDYRSRLRKK